MEMQNKSVYSSHTNQGGDMDELQGDRDKIKEAVMLCMDSVINSPSQFGVKALSDSAEMRKLKYMEKNVRQK